MHSFLYSVSKGYTVEPCLFKNSFKNVLACILWPFSSVSFVSGLEGFPHYSVGDLKVCSQLSRDETTLTNRMWWWSHMTSESPVWRARRSLHQTCWLRVLSTLYGFVFVC